MKNPKIKKVLVLGSGALKIGEAGEFDYSGSQALKALKEEGIISILVNPNIATYQTSENVADIVYFLPVAPDFIEKIIAKEKPDGIFLSFGGQTALNCGLDLWRKGIFRKYRVKVLGTPIKAVEMTENRNSFAGFMVKLKAKIPKSAACDSKKEVFEAIKKIGYPAIIRAGYALGGRGSGLAKNQAELGEIIERAFSASPQVLLEESVAGWKEIEYEVVRDANDNCIAVCNMENFDPMGIHTGESIVVAPSQTLTNFEYHMLRELAIKIVKKIGIIGECNIQFALNSKSRDYRVIEVNARLSRSSALASKATGYPLAYVAAKLALGYGLSEIKNQVTKATGSFFEPALDYLAVKIPRWDLQKFKLAEEKISTEMKSVGEIMALGRNFEEAIQKGLRMLQIRLNGFVGNSQAEYDRPNKKSLMNSIRIPTPKRILAISKALEIGIKPKNLSKMSGGIDPWFLERLKNITTLWQDIKKNKKLTKEKILELKQSGFSDKQIGLAINKTESDVRIARKKFGITPSIKQIDTLAAEFPAKTNYLYLTYNGNKNDIVIQNEKSKVIVLGSGPYSIGSSVEFDWCAVNSIKTLKENGYETIMINYNPETVSTDYDHSDKLYFDELSLERVMDIYEFEKPRGLVLSVGGQIPNNLASKLNKCKIPVLGTKTESIVRAEDRNLFSQLLDKIGVGQPRWSLCRNLDAAKTFSRKVGYPILVRPSFVLSGSAMKVIHREKDLSQYIKLASHASEDSPIVISKFEEGSKEIEVDAVAKNGQITAFAIMEHVENAGVHSGDATVVLPPQKVYLETSRRVEEITKKIAEELKITGPFNIQFLVKRGVIKVIECNLRASRSFPFVSKVTGINLIKEATLAMMNKSSNIGHGSHNLSSRLYDTVSVKTAQFSFSRIKGADPITHVEMSSTGEVAAFGNNLLDAFLKSLLAVGFKLPKKNILISIGNTEDKIKFLNSAKLLSNAGYKIFATPGTRQILKETGIDSKMVFHIHQKKYPSTLDLINKGVVELVINIPKNFQSERKNSGYIMRRRAVDLNIPLITNLQQAEILAKALSEKAHKNLEIKPWHEYLTPS